MVLCMLHRYAAVSDILCACAVLHCLLLLQLLTPQPGSSQEDNSSSSSVHEWLHAPELPRLLRAAGVLLGYSDGQPQALSLLVSKQRHRQETAVGHATRWQPTTAASPHDAAAG